MSFASVLIGPTILDHGCFDRDTCTEYAIQREERLGSRDQDLGERRRLLVVREGGAREWMKSLQSSVSAVSNDLLFFLALRTANEPEGE